jgi:hypothetical protein
MNAGAVAAFALAVVVAGLGALVVALVAKRRLRVGMAVFFVAAGFYVINLIVQQPIFFGIRATHVTGLLMTGLIAPAVYAFCEEIFRYLSFRVGKSMRANRTPDGAILAGLGHGGTESLLFTLGMAASVATAVFAPRTFIANGGDPNTILHGGPGFYLEFTLGRVLAIVAHLGFATLAVLAYRKSKLFLPIAIVAHFAVDASVFSLQGILPASSPVPDLVFAGWAALSIVLLVVVRRRLLPATTVDTAREPVPAAG